MVFSRCWVELANVGPNSTDVRWLEFRQSWADLDLYPWRSPPLPPHRLLKFPFEASENSPQIRARSGNCCELGSPDTELQGSRSHRHGTSRRIPPRHCHASMALKTCDFLNSGLISNIREDFGISKLGHWNPKGQCSSILADFGPTLLSSSGRRWSMPGKFWPTLAQLGDLYRTWHELGPNRHAFQESAWPWFRNANSAT